MNKKNLLVIGIIVAAGIGFYVWNSARIKALNAQREILIKQYTQLPPASSDRKGWLNVVSLLIGLGKNVYSEFQSGGLFYKKNNDFSGADLQDLINDPTRFDA